MTALWTSAGLLYRMLSFLWEKSLQNFLPLKWKHLEILSTQLKITLHSCFFFSFHLLFYLHLVYASSILVFLQSAPERAHCIGVSMATVERRDSKVGTKAPGAELMGEWRLDPAGPPPCWAVVVSAVIGHFITVSSSSLALTRWIVTRQGLLIISGVAQAIKHGAVFLHLMMRRSGVCPDKEGERDLKRGECFCVGKWITSII